MGSKLLLRIWKSTRQWKWLSRFDFLFALFCSILIFGAVGFCLKEPGYENDTPPIAFLRALQLFVLNAQTDVVGSQHWAFLFPKFLAPLFSAGAVLKLLDRQITKLVTERIVAGTKGHIVVIGLGKIGQPIVSSLLQVKEDEGQQVNEDKGKLIVAVDLDDDISDRWTFEATDKKSKSDLILFEGMGRGAQKLINLANCESASQVYLCTPSNLRNRTLLEVSQGKDKKSKDQKTFLYEDPPKIQSKALVTSTDPERSNDPVSFSVSHAAARMGVLFHPPFQCQESGMLDCPRIIVVGSNHLAGYLISEIAFIWESSMERERRFADRYPNGLKCACPPGLCPGETCQNKNQGGWKAAPEELRQPLTIDVVSTNAESFSRFLVESSRFLSEADRAVERALIINPVQVCGSELTRKDLLKAMPRARTVVYIVQDSIEQAEECEQRISVALNDAEIVILTVDDMSDYTWKDSTNLFGFLSNMPSTKWITGESTDKLKKGVHQKVWCDTRSYEGNEETCYDALLAFGSQVSACGLSVRRTSSPTPNITSEAPDITTEAKEKLARIEHERWCRQVLSEGILWGQHKVNHEGEPKRRPALLNFEAEFLKEKTKDGMQPDKATGVSIHDHNLDQIDRWNTLLTEFNLFVTDNNKSQK